MTGIRHIKALQNGMTLIELTVVFVILVAMAGLAMPAIRGTHDMAMCQATDATLQAVKQAIMGGAAGTGYYADTLGEYPKTTQGLTTADYSLDYLFNTPGHWNKYNPKTGVGWRGPYLQGGGLLGTERAAALHNSFGAYDAATNPDGKAHIDHRVTTITQVFDAWGRPIILQIPYDTATTHPTPQPEYARLVSAGPTLSLAVIDTKIQYDSSVDPLPNAADRKNDRVLYLKMPDPLPGGNKPCNE